MLLRAQNSFIPNTLVRYGVIAAILAGCATSNTGIPPVSEMLASSTGQNGRACIRQHEIRGYGVLQNNIVSIDGGRQYYLATVLPGCNDLHTSMGVMFSGDFHEICGQSMDRIVTGGSWCGIDRIFEFDSRSEAFDLYQSVGDRRQALKQEREQETKD